MKENTNKEFNLFSSKDDNIEKENWEYILYKDKKT